VRFYEHFELSGSQFELLRSEAKQLEASADLVGSDTCALEFGIAVNDRGRCRVSGPGRNLRAFHKLSGLDFASEFSGIEAPIFPTRASYIYYESGDYSFFHHDAASAHITLIVAISDELTPLVLFPQFGRATPADIVLLNRMGNLPLYDLCTEMGDAFGERGRSVEVELPLGCALAIPGRAIPHARPQQTSGGAVCTMCYSFIDPPSAFAL